ncbi:Bacteriophage abortive infection AbiH [Paenibacillus polysaccharolyticus]|uniref:Bacteriophage abortive infection AbiH n=1 Tax=Paenibacillus polysaccharolyticus TaxID=582692 RepID=A0A1G5KZ79_9BACL|nr:AbiH family protein [Paenibacillus polysaccharolyticus]SCZ05915.1 Bacteriophage abortive infection AbiH [Paenibacillus polysaccharolyticus]
MKILVIGNGFDLAHGLPTKYNDFLKFLSLIKAMSMYRGGILNFIEKHLNETSKVNNNIKQYIHKLITELTQEYGSIKDESLAKNVDLFFLVDKSENKVIREILDNIKGNYWYQHFVSVESYINEGWIDFESEISRVIQALEQYRIKECFDQKDIVEKGIEQTLLSVSVRENNPDTSKFKVDGKLLQKLEEDLTKLIRSLEIFLVNCVENIDIESTLPDIKNINFDKVLSFNYTNTYEKGYVSLFRPKFDFIHGKADSKHNLETNNMVLGIDEYLDSTQASKNTSFISYKKYFQRIHKETGCVYKDWIRKNNSQSSSELYIFGHSLDITDKDVLRELIEMENMKTTIFYYNKKVYSSQIANLVKVLGVDNLISRVHGENKSITFKQQQSPIKDAETPPILDEAVR